MSIVIAITITTIEYLWVGCYRKALRERIRISYSKHADLNFGTDESITFVFHVVALIMIWSFSLALTFKSSFVSLDVTVCKILLALCIFTLGGLWLADVGTAYELDSKQTWRRLLAKLRVE